MKRNIHTLIGLAFFLILAISSIKVSAQITADEAVGIMPPRLVKCHTNASCDRDPEHLKAFVSGFYKWVASNFNSFDLLIKDQSSPEERQKHIEDFSKNETRIMRKLLTPEFYHWTTIYTNDPPPKPDPRYCLGGTALLCSQAWNDDQIANATIKITSINKIDAKAVVTLTALHKFETAYELVVKLKVVKGAWRIEGITRPSY